MVSEKGDRMGGPLEVVVPMVKGMDNGEQLAIIDIVVSFGRGEGLGEISARVKIPITIPLHKHSSTSKKGCIHHDDKWSLDVGEVQDWSGLEVRQQGGECSLLRSFPYPGKILSSEGGEGGDDV